jgi:hypothetical protein
VTTPELFGFYSSILLILGLFQGLFEGLIRNSSSRLAKDPVIFTLIETLSRKFSYIGSVALACFATFQYFRMEVGAFALLEVLPLLLAPYVLVKSSKIQRQFQLEGRWGELLVSRIIGSLVALVVFLIAMNQSVSLFWAALFLPISEMIVFLLLRTKTKRELIANDSRAINSALIPARREIGSFLAFQSLTWVQSQTDRFLVSLFASPVSVGLFFMTSALSRLPSEISIGSLTSLLRNQLSPDLQLDARQRLTVDCGQRLLVLNLFIYIVGGSLSILFIEKLNPDFAMVPLLVLVLSASIFARGTASTLWTRAIFETGTSGTRKTQVSSIALTVIGGGIVCLNLAWGVAFLVLREIATAMWILWKWKNFSTRSLTLQTIAFTLLSLVVASLSSLEIAS